MPQGHSSTLRSIENKLEVNFSHILLNTCIFSFNVSIEKKLSEGSIKTH